MRGSQGDDILDVEHRPLAGLLCQSEPVDQAAHGVRHAAQVGYDALLGRKLTQQ
jgi:hypothetical protein